MRKICYLFLILVGISGCAAQRPYGDFLDQATPTNEKKIADDVMKRLTVVYPPAKTSFDLQQNTDDVFGSYFVADLRAQGYGLLEFKQKTDTSKNFPATLGIPLSYILDQGSDLYRITVLVGEQSMTRAYLVQDGTVFPAGSWVRKE